MTSTTRLVIVCTLYPNWLFPDNSDNQDFNESENIDCSIVDNLIIQYYV